MTTSDGVLVNERMVEPGDWTGPGGAAQIIGRHDVDVAVLETARGGIVLRGVGYESNDASVLTNVSSDHLDLQGIHTLPELAEVKATICRITKPDGWVVLNADDRWVAAIARQVRAHVAYFTLEGDRSAVVAHGEHTLPLPGDKALDHGPASRTVFVPRSSSTVAFRPATTPDVCRRPRRPVLEPPRPGTTVRRSRRDPTHPTCTPPSGRRERIAQEPRLRPATRRYRARRVSSRARRTRG